MKRESGIFRHFHINTHSNICIISDIFRDYILESTNWMLLLYDYRCMKLFIFIADNKNLNTYLLKPMVQYNKTKKGNCHLERQICIQSMTSHQIKYGAVSWNESNFIMIELFS